MVGKSIPKRTRGKAWTQAENDQIRIRLEVGQSASEIALKLGRGRASVYLQIKNMREAGTLGQSVLDLGQADE